MKALDKEYNFYAFMSIESDMIGNPIRYEVKEGLIAQGLVADLSEKVSFDVGKIIDVLKSKVPFGEKWSNVVMLDTLKNSTVVHYYPKDLKFEALGKVCDLLPADFFGEAENLAQNVRKQKQRYDEHISEQIKKVEEGK